jgi:hypothetical protein
VLKYWQVFLLSKALAYGLKNRTKNKEVLAKICLFEEKKLPVLSFAKVC